MSDLILYGKEILLTCYEEKISFEPFDMRRTRRNIILLVSKLY